MKNIIRTSLTFSNPDFEYENEINNEFIRNKILEIKNSIKLNEVSISRWPSGLRKTRLTDNSLAHRTTWLRFDLLSVSSCMLFGS